MAADTTERDIFQDEQGSRDRRTAGLGSALCALALIVPLVWTVGVTPVDMPFMDGVAWLSNGSRGEVVQVNGTNGQVQAALDVGNAEEIAISQSDQVVMVEVDGELRSIDLSLLQWQGSTPADGELVVGEDGDGQPVLYLIEASGNVRWLDPYTLETLGEVSLAGEPSSGGVVSEGRLFVPVAAERDSLVQVVDGTRQVGEVEVGAADDLVKLARLGDEVAVLNVTAGSLGRLAPDSSLDSLDNTVDVDVPEGDISLPEELPEGHLWLASVRTSELLAVDVDSGDTVGTVTVGAPRNDLVGPVVLDEIAYIADRDAGELVLVDTESVTEIRRERLSDYDIDDASQVELLAQGGRVFLNDPNSHVAIIFNNDGAAVPVDKYEQGEGVATMPASDFVSGNRPESDAPEEEGPEAQEEPSRSEGSSVTASDSHQADPSAVQPADTGSGSPGAGDPGSGGDPTTGDPGSGDPPTDPGPAPDPDPGPMPDPGPDPGPDPEPDPVPPPDPDPAPEPPGGIGAIVPQVGDGQVTLSWSAADSSTPVTYHVSSNRAIEGTTSWAPTDTSISFSGLTNGETYRFTVTPTNDAGNGPSETRDVTPQGAASINSLSAESTGDRSFRVTGSYSGGDSVDCTLTLDGSPVSGVSCAGGSVSAEISVATYNTSYTIALTVSSPHGPDDSDSTTATSAAKPLSVYGSYDRWGGSCYTIAGHGSNRPVHDAPLNACLDGNGPDSYSYMVSHGSTQRALCYRHDFQLSDDTQTLFSDVWVQLDGGWMNALYFSDWGSVADNLPTC